MAHIMRAEPIPDVVLCRILLKLRRGKHRPSENTDVTQPFKGEESNCLGFLVPRTPRCPEWSSSVHVSLNDSWVSCVRICLHANTHLCSRVNTQGLLCPMWTRTESSVPTEGATPLLLCLSVLCLWSLFSQR